MNSMKTDRDDPATEGEIVKSDLQRRWSDGAPSTFQGTDASAAWSMARKCASSRPPTPSP